jgi:hypothetical protein
MVDDADAAAASTSSPATPTSILICREDGNDIFPDADAGADFSVAGDECLLAVDPDHEYVAVLLSKESASVAPAQEMAEWMKAARSGCVRWIMKVVRAVLLSPFAAFTFSFLCEIRSSPVTRCSLCGVFADHRDVPVQREDGVRSGDLPGSILGAAGSRCNAPSLLPWPMSSWLPFSTLVTFFSSVWC